MSMPKATAHLDHATAARQHDIWASWKPLVVQHVAQASSMQGPTHEHLRASVLTPDKSHLRAAGRIGQEQIASNM